MMLQHFGASVLDKLYIRVKLFTDLRVQTSQPLHPCAPEVLPTSNMIVPMKNVMEDSDPFPEVRISVETILCQLASIVIEDLSGGSFFVFVDCTKWVLSALTTLHQMKPITMSMLWAEKQEHVAKPPSIYCGVHLLAWVLLRRYII